MTAAQATLRQLLAAGANTAEGSRILADRIAAKAER